MEQGTLVLSSSNVQNGEVVDADNVYINPEVVNSCNVKLGDIIVVVRNGSRSLIGKHGQIKEEMSNTVIGAFMTGVRSDNANFVNALLDTQKFREEIYKNLGATINQITNKMFCEMSFMFPGKEEQEKIGTFFASLDKLISLHQRKLDEVEEYKKGMMERLFPKKGEKSPELRFEGFNEEWNEKRLGDCFIERNERSSEGELISVTINDGVKRFIDLDRHDNSSDDKSKYKCVKMGDIAYNSMRMWQGASGYSRYSGILSPAYTVIKAKDNFSSIFFSYFFKDPRMIYVFKSNSQGLTSDTWTLRFSAFKKIKVRVPSLNEQKKIGSFFLQIDKAINLQKEKIKLLKEEKKGFMQRMFI